MYETRSLLRELKRKMMDSLPMAFRGPVHILGSGRLLHRYRFLRRNVGKGSYIDPSVMIFGWRNVTVGHNTSIGENVWLNVNFRENPEKKITIGDNCHVAKDCYFSCGPGIQLKDYSFIGLGSNLLGCGHRFDDALVPYIASGLYPGGLIEIGVNCWLTTNVTVLEGVRIGHGSVIGSASVVTRDVPPFSIAVGSPCKVIRRFDFEARQWIDIADWNEQHEKNLPHEETYLTLLREEYGTVPMPLITTGRRFGWL